MNRNVYKLDLSYMSYKQHDNGSANQVSQVNDASQDMKRTSQSFTGITASILRPRNALSRCGAY